MSDFNAISTAIPTSVNEYTQAPNLNKFGSMKQASYEDVKKSVQDFEAFFLTQAFETMYNTVPVNENFGGGNGEKIFRSMLMQEYGKMTAQAGGIGLTNEIMAQLVASGKVVQD